MFRTATAEYKHEQIPFTNLVQLVKTLRQPLGFLQLFKGYLVGKKSNLLPKSLFSLIDLFSFIKSAHEFHWTAVILSQVVAIFCFCVISVF